MLEYVPECVAECMLCCPKLKGKGLDSNISIHEEGNMFVLENGGNPDIIVHMMCCASLSVRGLESNTPSSNEEGSHGLSRQDSEWEQWRGEVVKVATLEP